MTRVAVPSITRSNGWVATLTTQRGSASMLRDLRVAGPEVNAALAEATAAMQARFTDEAFERQVALVKEKQALELRLANLVQSNEDARAFGSEDD